MYKTNASLQSNQKNVPEEKDIIPIVDFLKDIRNDLHEDLLKQQSFTDFLKDLPSFFERVAEEVGKKTEIIEALQRDLKEYTNIKGKFQEFEKRVQNHDELMKDKEQEIESLKGNNAELFKENDILGKKNKDLEFKVKDLSTKCEELSKGIKKEEENTQKLIKAHEKTLAENIERTDTLLKDKEESHKKSIKEHEEANQLLSNEIKDLSNRLESQQEDLKKLSKLQNEKKNLQEELQKLTKAHDDAKKKFLKESIDLQNDLVESERVIEHQRKVIEDLKSELKEAEAEYDDINKALKEKESQVEDRGAKLKKLGGEVQVMVQKIVEMNKLSDKLIQENEGLKRELQRVGTGPVAVMGTGGPSTSRGGNFRRSSSEYVTFAPNQTHQQQQYLQTSYNNYPSWQ